MPQPRTLTALARRLNRFCAPGQNPLDYPQTPKEAEHVRPALTLTLLALIGATAACAPRGYGERDPAASRAALMDGTGTCWGTDVTPATIETVTEHRLVQPAQVNSDGTVRTPAVYRTITQPKITRARRELRFATPCADQFTPEFIMSVQRALSSRGLYRGPIHGILDARTGRAIRAFQDSFGLSSAMLSIEGARRLGLIAVTREEAEAHPFVSP